jgi:hypothetical protein
MIREKIITITENGQGNYHAEGAPMASKACEPSEKSVPASLVELVATQNANIKEFVNRAGRKAPDESDIAATLAADTPMDAVLERALDVARECRRTGRRTPALIDWCTRALKSQVPDLSDSSGGRDKDGLALLHTLAVLAQRSRDDKESRKRAELALSLGINLLTIERSVDGFEVLRTLWPVLSTDIALGKRTPRQHVSELVAQASTKTLRDLTIFAGLVEEHVARAETASLRATRELHEVLRERDALHGAVSELKGEVSRLQAELEDATRRESELTARLKDAETCTAHTANTFKARTRRVLGERIGGLLSDADEALAIQPPEVEVTRERIEMARAEIRKELEWLATSGG